VEKRDPEEPEGVVDRAKAAALRRAGVLQWKMRRMAEQIQIRRAEDQVRRGGRRSICDRRRSERRRARFEARQRRGIRKSRPRWTTRKLRPGMSPDGRRWSAEKCKRRRRSKAARAARRVNRLRAAR